MDKSELSEALGVYANKEKAIDALLEAANYRERDGRLTQYMIPTDDYESFSILREKVAEDMRLLDYDEYRITELPCL